MIKISKLSEVSHEIRQALNHFEKQFHYALGKDKHFTISHGQHYENFFRSIGSETIFIAHENGSVIGTLAVVERTLIIEGKTSSALYLADLKVSPQRKQALFQLLQSASQSFDSYSELPQFGVVMQDENMEQHSPQTYTGRLGVASFEKLADIAIIRYPLHSKEGSCSINSDFLTNLPNPVTMHDICLPSDQTQLRSKYEPRTYHHPALAVSAILEDTLKSKNLFCEHQEICSGHLTCFSYNTPTQAIEFIKKLEGFAAQFYPALFFAVPKHEQHIFLDTLENSSNAPASIYGRNKPNLANQYCRDLI
jgi:hypothetical protein